MVQTYRVTLHIPVEFQAQDADEAQTAVDEILEDIRRGLFPDVICDTITDAVSADDPSVV